MVKANQRQIPALIEAREPFEGSNIFGNAYPTGARCTSGRLNVEEAAKFYTDSPRIRYVVFSYYTPIAWVLEDGTTYRTPQKFSVTTSKHMVLLRGF